MQIYLSLAVCLIGLILMLIYGPPSQPGHPTRSRIGEIMFLCGLLAFLMTFHPTVGFLK